MNEIEKKYLLSENGKSYFKLNQDSSEIGDLVLQASLEDLRAIEKDSSRKNIFRVNQGYLDLIEGKSLGERLGVNMDFNVAEARLRAKGDKYFFTAKSDGGLSRIEEEVEIDEGVYNKNWPATLGRRVEKIRLEIPYGGLIAEVDLYTDRDLITAEVECPNRYTALNLMPMGKDITEDKAYKNKNLAK